VADGQVASESQVVGGISSTYVYQYDADGNRTQEVDTTQDGNGQAVTLTTTTTYDSHDRISQYTQTGSQNTSASLAVPTLNLTYSYDAAGNRREVIATSGSTTTATGSTTTDWYTYDADNRVLVTNGSLVNNQIVITTATNSAQSGYDAAGNVTLYTTINASGQTLSQKNSYDTRNDLTMIQSQTAPGGSFAVYETRNYDANGHLLADLMYNLPGHQGAGVYNGSLVTFNDAGWVASDTVYTYDASGQLSDVSVYAEDTAQDLITQYGTGVATSAYATQDASPPGSRPTLGANRDGALYLASENSYAASSGFGYDAAGNLLGYHTITSGNLGQTARTDSYKNTYVLQDTSLNLKTTASTTSGSYTPDTNTNTYNALAEVTKTTGSVSGSAVTKAQAYNADGRILRSTTVGSNATVYAYENDEGLASVNNSATVNVLDTTSGFSNSVLGSQNYTVHTGDTLQSLAQAIYGDSHYDYILAQANGLRAGSPLTPGSILKIPQVTTHTNASHTFKPYSVSAILSGSASAAETTARLVDDAVEATLAQQSAIAQQVAKIQGEVAQQEEAAKQQTDDAAAKGQQAGATSTKRQAQSPAEEALAGAPAPQLDKPLARAPAAAPARGPAPQVDKAPGGGGGGGYGGYGGGYGGGGYGGYGGYGGGYGGGGYGGGYGGSGGTGYSGGTGGAGDGGYDGGSGDGGYDGGTGDTGGAGYDGGTGGAGASDGDYSAYLGILQTITQSEMSSLSTIESDAESDFSGIDSSLGVYDPAGYAGYLSIPYSLDSDLSSLGDTVTGFDLATAGTGVGDPMEAYFANVSNDPSQLIAYAGPTAPQGSPGFAGGPFVISTDGDNGYSVAGDSTSDQSGFNFQFSNSIGTDANGNTISDGMSISIGYTDSDGQTLFGFSASTQNTYEQSEVDNPSAIDGASNVWNIPYTSAPNELSENSDGSLYASLSSQDFKQIYSQYGDASSVPNSLEPPSLSAGDYIGAGLTTASSATDQLFKWADKQGMPQGAAAESAESSVFGMEYGVKSLLADVPSIAGGAIAVGETYSAYAAGDYKEATESGGAALGAIAGAEVFGAAGLLAGPFSPIAVPVLAGVGALVGAFAGKEIASDIYNNGFEGNYNLLFGPPAPSPDQGRSLLIVPGLGPSGPF
jgi:hypothetical protein